MAVQEKPKVIPVDDFIRDELYPGYTLAFGTQPFVAGPVRPFSKTDNASYWLRDSLYFSEGMVPTSIALLDDAQTWGAQLDAEIVGCRRPGDRSTGWRARTSTSARSTWTPTCRSRRGPPDSASMSGRSCRTSTGTGGCGPANSQSADDHFDGLDLASMDPGQLWTAVKDGYAFHRRAWFIHFEVMYVLTANYLAFYQLAEEIGLEGSRRVRLPVRPPDLLW